MSAAARFALAALAAALLAGCVGPATYESWRQSVCRDDGLARCEDDRL